MKTLRLLPVYIVLLAGLMISCEKDSTEKTDGTTPTPSVGGFDNVGASNALFSVSPTNQVHFSCGNLQYNAISNEWRFASHQYDFIGVPNQNASATYSGWIDLFGWGTSGWNSGTWSYQPWSTETYSTCYCPGNQCTNDLTGAYAEADWAWHNAISNGGNSAHMWRTMTNDEWTYLITGRANATSKCGYAKVDTTYGMVVLPDVWTLPSGLSFTPGCNGSSISDTSNCNVYTLTEWNSMENAGAIFLPAAGFRVGDYVQCDNNSGYYWSTTAHDTVNAKLYLFRPSFHYPYEQYRLFGFSVRPVKD